MADYFVEFIGAIVEGTRPAGFPKKISSSVVIRAENSESLKNATNIEFNRILKNHGMVVPIDPSGIQSTEYVPDGAVFVPMHMIAYLGTRTKRLSEDYDASLTAH